MANTLVFNYIDSAKKDTLDKALGYIDAIKDARVIAYDDTNIRRELRDVSAFAHDIHIPSYVGELTNDAGYLVNDDISSFITNDELESKGYLTEHQSLDGYALNADINIHLNNLDASVEAALEVVRDDVSLALAGARQDLDNGMLNVEQYTDDKVLALNNELTSIINANRTAAASDLEYAVTRAKGDLDASIQAVDAAKQDKFIVGNGLALENGVLSSTIDTTLFRIVDELPATDIEDNKIYLVSTHNSTVGDIYTEHIHTDGGWEKLGEFKATTDLSGYYNKDQIDNIVLTTRQSIESSISTIQTNNNLAHVEINGQISALQTEDTRLQGVIDEHAATNSTAIQNLQNTVADHKVITDANTNNIIDLDSSLNALASKEASDFATLASLISNGDDNIGGALQSIQANTNAIQAEVSNRESAVSGLEATMNSKFADLDSSVNSAIEGLDSSANTKIDGINDTINSRIDELDSSVNSKFAEITEELDTKAAQSDLDALSSTVDTKAAQSDLETLSTTVGTKAAQSDLDALSSTVDTKAAQSDLESLTETVDTKADQSDLEALSSTVGTKATQSDFEALSSTVGTKASQADLEELSSSVDNKVDLENFEALTDTVNTKAAQADLDSLSSVVDTKASQTALTELTSIVNAKADQTSLDDVSTSLSALSSTVEHLSGLPKLHYEVVEQLPEDSSADPDAIYLLNDSESPNNVFTEYIYVNGNYEILGTQKFNINDYATSAYVDGKVSELNTKDSEIDASIVALGSQIQTLDASIVENISNIGALDASVVDLDAKAQVLDTSVVANIEAIEALQDNDAIQDGLILDNKNVIDTLGVEISESFEYIYDEDSWNESFANGVLKKYYTKYPDEDLWNPTEHRAVNFNDKAYVANIYNDNAGTDLVKEAQFKASWASSNAQKITNTEDANESYYLAMFYSIDDNVYELFTDVALSTSANLFIKINSFSFPGCTQCWEGAVQAPGAKFPWICPIFDEDVNAIIKFQYEGENDAYPWNIKLFGNGEGHKEWGIASVAEEFKNKGFLIDANKNNGAEDWDGEVGADNFDLSKFKMVLIKNGAIRSYVDKAIAEIPAPDLSGYVPLADFNDLKSKYETLLSLHIDLADRVDAIELEAQQTNAEPIVLAAAPVSQNDTTTDYVIEGTQEIPAEVQDSVAVTGNSVALSNVTSNAENKNMTLIAQ